MKRRLPPLGALRAFEAAARLGRMTAAADELSVSPGAISRQVRLLEDHLGLPLFDGSKARPTLTVAARALQPVLTLAFAQIADAVQALRPAVPGPLDVACFSTFTVKWLIPRLFDFHARHPGVEVRLCTTDSGADAPTGAADLQIIARDVAATSADLAAGLMPLFAERVGPVLAPALAARIGALQQPADLAGKPLLHTRARRDAWQLWLAGRAAQGPGLDAAAGPVYDHYYFTLEAAVRGLGIAVAPWHLVMDDLASGRLVAPFGFSLSGYQYAVRQRPGAAHPQAGAFSAWLLAQAQGMPLP